MSKVVFTPSQSVADVNGDTKLLVAAKRAGAYLRFGCASCRCGTCAVAVNPSSALSPMKENERALLARMKLVTDGSIRLSCQARVLMDHDVVVDVSFQDTYSPDDGDEF